MCPEAFMSVFVFLKEIFSFNYKQINKHLVILLVSGSQAENTLQHL